MASTYLTRNNSSAVTAERKKYTISFWVKRSATGVQHALCSAGNGGGSEEFTMRFNTSDQIDCFHYNGSSHVGRLITNRKFRDLNAWYHIYFVYDSANATQADRFMLYVNGERETSFSTNIGLAQDDLSPWNVDERHQIGSNSWGNSGNGSSTLDGCMSHFYNVAGSHIAITEFGSTDSTTGEWKINTNPTIASYGTAGFLVLKDGNTVTDQSGNSNNFTVGGGTLTKTEDNPSNIFATLNPLDCDLVSGLSNGNNTFSGFNTGTDYSATSSTLSASSGKFYWEAKVTDLAEIDQVGVRLQNGVSMSIQGGNGTAGLQGTAYGGKGCQFSNGYKVGDGSGGAYMGGFSANDIMMIALDLDNNKITFGRNGQWANGSGGADQTYANSTAAYTNLTAGEFYCPAQTSRSYGSNSGTTQYNFGNGYFGTTAVSSAGTNASGNGIFEYDVPSGFTALSTKGLNL